MDIWIFDLDGVLQRPAYPHPQLMLDVSVVTGVPYEELYRHYSTSFTTNEELEDYQISLCHGDQKKIDEVKAFWRRLHAEMPNAPAIPGATDLLEEIRTRGWEMLAYTKVADDRGLEIQRERLRRNDHLRFFPTGRILHSSSKGTIEGFKKIVLASDSPVVTLNPQRKVVVGDSFLQDILPPLQLGGFICVWIRWDQEPPEGADLDDPNLIIVESTQTLATKVNEGLLDVRNDH